MPAILVKSIKPKRFRLPNITKAVRRQVRKEARLLIRDFEATTSTWRGKPTFKALTQVAPTRSGDIVVVVGPTGPNANKYLWLDKGTTVRWALMGRGFRPKTKANSLVVGSGSPPFEPVIRGRSAMRVPRPGIKARNFSLLIEKKRRKGFQRNIFNAIRDAEKKEVQ